MISVEEAIQRITNKVHSLAIEHVELNAAMERILGADLLALRTQPPFAASAMDGYAVRADDVIHAPTLLKQIGISLAGAGFDGIVNAGETVRIFTGAPVPNGADTVLIQEKTELTEDHCILVKEAVKQGQNIRQEGSDFQQNQLILSENERITEAKLALAASANHPTLPCRQRPKVAILATGDELVHPGQNPGRHQIIASNTVMIAALIKKCGGEVIDLGIAPDNLDIIAAKIDEAYALHCNIIVTLGGASVGDHDFIHDALINNGMKLDFWRIAMRPGKPLLFGHIGKTHVLGLPGNPVSSYVCAILFLKPLIHAFLGISHDTPLQDAIIDREIPANDQRETYLRAVYKMHHDHGRPLVQPLSNQDSSHLTQLAQANCLLVRRPHAPSAKPGDSGNIILL